MRHIYIFLFAVVVTFNVVADPMPIEIPDNTTKENKIIIGQAVDVFLKSCPSLRGYWSDIESISATPYVNAGGEYEYRTELYGWNNWIHVTLKVSDNPLKIPPEFYAAGHTLHFNVGAGDRPGAIAKKKQSSDICGTPMDEDDGDFFDIATLRIVDDLN